MICTLAPEATAAAPAAGGGEAAWEWAVAGPARATRRHRATDSVICQPQQALPGVVQDRWRCRIPKKFSSRRQFQTPPSQNNNTEKRTGHNIAENVRSHERTPDSALAVATASRVADPLPSCESPSDNTRTSCCLRRLLPVSPSGRHNGISRRAPACWLSGNRTAASRPHGMVVQRST